MKLNDILNRPFTRVLGLTVFTAALTACCSLSAQPKDGKGGASQPPPEALAACQSLSSGHVCSFTSPRGAMKGTCWAPEGKPLACKPKDAPFGSPPLPNSKYP
jgi:hypothetical protein